MRCKKTQKEQEQEGEHEGEHEGERGRRKEESAQIGRNEKKKKKKIDTYHVVFPVPGLPVIRM